MKRTKIDGKTLFCFCSFSFSFCKNGPGSKKPRSEMGFEFTDIQKTDKYDGESKNISLGSVGDSTLDITVPGNHILDVFEYEHFFLGCFQDGFSASQEGWSLQEMVTERL
jgi:hypothetical protein